MNYKERDPVLVDSYDQAVEKNEIALGMKLEDLKKDLTDIWGKLDDIINNRWNLFGVKDEYFVNTEEWLEFQGKASELDPKDESVVYTIPEQMRRMEFEVSKYYPHSRLKLANHLEKEIQELNDALGTISHIMSHLDVAIVTDSVVTSDQGEVPF